MYEQRFNMPTYLTIGHARAYNTHKIKAAEGRVKENGEVQIVMCHI